MRRWRVFWFWRRAAATRLGVAAGRRRVFVSLCSGGSGSAAVAGFCVIAAATANDHVDVDHGNGCVGDVELDEDLDVVVQLDVDVRLGVVPALLGAVGSGSVS